MVLPKSVRQELHWLQKPFTLEYYNKLVHDVESSSTNNENEKNIIEINEISEKVIEFPNSNTVHVVLDDLEEHVLSRHNRDDSLNRIFVQPYVSSPVFPS